MVNKEEVLSILKSIQYPGFQKDIISVGLIKDITISDDAISVLLDMRTNDDGVINTVKDAVRNKLQSLKGIKSVAVEISGPGRSAHSDGEQTSKEEYLPEVKYRIAVASGKGGVGKSTVSVNLAVALAKIGYRVGLLDSDIYGPSIPLMLGVSHKPEFDGQKLLPIEKYGVKLMSLGFLVDDKTPVIWRGPLVMRALQQLMKDVHWGSLDVMLFDMPPGTGDAQLTISQSINLDGAIIVSTPQDVALIDAIKGVEMFKKVHVPILGIIENMSYFICQSCGTRTDIFSAGGARKECSRLEVNLLGEIPLDVAIRIGGDKGMPIVIEDDANEQSIVFINIAKNIAKNF
jgi:ATP-binding protein involved in chromosome partitioning